MYFYEINEYRFLSSQIYRFSYTNNALPKRAKLKTNYTRPYRPLKLLLRSGTEHEARRSFQTNHIAYCALFTRDTHTHYTAASRAIRASSVACSLFSRGCSVTKRQSFSLARA